MYLLRKRYLRDVFKRIGGCVAEDLHIEIIKKMVDLFLPRK